MGARPPLCTLSANRVRGGEMGTTFNRHGPRLGPGWVGPRMGSSALSTGLFTRVPPSNGPCVHGLRFANHCSPPTFAHTYPEVLQR